MVSLVRRLTGVRRVGHAGTLDPLASGVLPVAIGRATRLIEFLDDTTKTYVARVQFGVETDTYDADGQVTGSRDASSVTEFAVRAALRSFEGEIEQTPPMFSAVKLAGRPLYEYARSGEKVAVRPRRVVVESITLVGFEAQPSGGDARIAAPKLAGPTAMLELVCSKGTYVRSIAHDLGTQLGCGAHVAALRRIRSGGFDVREAWSPDALIEVAGEGRLEAALLAPDRAVERQKAAIMGPKSAADFVAGRNVQLDEGLGAREDEICRAYDTEGQFLGVIAAGEGWPWRPLKVMVRP
jgi:tRNA pseudouridine55 synthase